MIGMMADLPVRDSPEMTLIRPRSKTTVRIVCFGFFGHKMILLIWKSTKRSPAFVNRFVQRQPENQAPNFSALVSIGRIGSGTPVTSGVSENDRRVPFRCRAKGYWKSGRDVTIPRKALA